MMTITFVFWLMVALFAIVGAMRGWAKELLVTFAVIVGLFIITVLERFVPFMRDTITGTGKFWSQTAILVGLVFFAYQTPNLARIAASGRFVREHLQDTLLGLFLGALNGFLIFGSIWFYLHEVNYPFAYITAPVAGTPLGDAALKLIPLLAPHWMGPPMVYFAVALAFVFVLVVFI